MNKRDKIIDKIRRLREMTEENGASESEAQVFAERAADLMAKHAVEESEITSPPEHIMDYKEIKYLNPWRRNLLEAVGRTCFVQVLYHKGSNQVALTGRPLNIEAFYEMFRFIEKQCVEIARQLYPGVENRKAQRRAEGGLALGVALKLVEHNKKNMNSLLPVVQEMDAAREAMHEMVGEGNISTMKEKPTKKTEEFMNGAMNANRVKLREDIS